MKKLPLAFALVAGLSLASCATGTTTLTPATLTTTLTTVENDIIGFAQSLCSFQPSVATVEGIISTLYPGAALVTVPEQAIAATICGAVPPAAVVAAAKLSGRLGATPILYPGTNIVIHGTYVARVGGRLRR